MGRRDLQLSSRTLDLRDVRYFLAICEHRSLTTAARSCRVTQPCITKSLDRFERAVGRRLFERSRPVQPTTFATELLPFLQQLQGACDRVCAFVRDCGDGALADSGPLHCENVDCSSAP